MLIVAAALTGGCRIAPPCVMPKNRRKPPETPSLTPRMRRHLGRLGLRSVERYLIWCRAYGFAPTTDKRYYDLEEEMQALEQAKRRVAEQARLEHNPGRLIERICAGEVKRADIARPQLRDFCQCIEASPADRASRHALCKLLLKVNREADFLLETASFGGHQYRYIDALINLNRRRSRWIAPLDFWRPVSHTGRRQFSSLARHLTARFPVPLFMDEAWFRSEPGSERYRDWFFYIGAGENIRTLPTPIPMTKLMAHHFLEAPKTYRIESAIRWGQVHALGGDRRLTEALLGSPIRSNFAENEFWTSVIRFFIANPMLDRRHVAPIIDYLHAQKFETREVIIGPGDAEVRPPAQPNLSMRGRTAAGLLAQVERWHRELGRERGTENLYFKQSGTKGLALKTGRDGENVWEIRELLSGAELAAEGQVMRHCVESYARSCFAGRCSIWAMELRTPLGVEKRQTIELTRDGVIVQSRGKQNRLPTAAEFEVLKEWARGAGVTISPYVRAG